MISIESAVGRLGSRFRLHVRPQRRKTGHRAPVRYFDAGNGHRVESAVGS